MLEARIDEKRLPSGEVLLRDVALAARPGGMLALLGASGTGKTTTLRILLGLDRAFTGTVTGGGRVAVVFQEPRLLPWRSVAENIRVVAPRGQVDVEGLLGAVGLAGTAALYPGQLSLGMARRVALARALAVAPDVLLLDEPFASLDPGTTGVIAGCLRRLMQDGRTAIVVAMHDIGLATELATEIVMLDGRPAGVAYRTELGEAAGARAEVHAALVRRFAFAGAGDGLSISPGRA